MAQSVEHATAVRTFPGSSLGHSLFFGHNQGPNIYVGSIKKHKLHNPPPKA